jgi:hypothetical protein
VSERVALQTDFGGNDRGYRWFMAFDWSVGLFRIFRRLLNENAAVRRIGRLL